MRKLFLVALLLASISTYSHGEKWDENRDGWSPLMLAIYKGKTESFMKLITQKVDVNYLSKSKYSDARITALEVAIRMNNEVAVNSLLLTNRISNPEKYLMTAAGQNSMKVIELLIKYGGNPNETLENGYSILMMATGFSSKDVFECLLKKGANPNQAKTNGMTVLMLAGYGAKIEKIKLLIKYNADKDVKDSKGWTALDYFNKYCDIRKVSEEDKTEIRELLK